MCEILYICISPPKASSHLGALFSFVPEVYINILPILLDTVMDFSHHDLHVQFEITGNMQYDFQSVQSFS